MPRCFSAVLRATRWSCPRLNEAAGFLRNGLFKRLHIHTVPTLHFHFDRTTERAADMNALIAKANASRARTRTDERAAPDGLPAPLHGVLLLDKPLGWTSNDALQKAKGLLRAEKAGHTGTLDPLATGCCRCASARPPSSARSAWTPTSATGHAALGQRTSTATARARSSKSARCTDRAAACEPPARASPAHRAGAADALGAEEGRASAVRIRPRRRRGRAHAARVTIHRIDIVDWHDPTW
jgi:hypothetical protein